MTTRTKGSLNRLKALALFAAASLGAANSQAATMGLSLVLDGSGSIGRSDFSLQVDAYQSIFQDDFFTNFLQDFSTFGDLFYVNTYQFSSGVAEEIGFTLIDSDEAAFEFGAQFASISQMGAGTNTAAATREASAALVEQGYDRKVIDISTDGLPANRAAAIDEARAANAQGVQVNALGVGQVNPTFLQDFSEAGGGFYATAPNFTEFRSSLADKLQREISAPSLPGGPQEIPEIDLAGGPLAFGLLAGIFCCLRESRRRSATHAGTASLRVASA